MGSKLSSVLPGLVLLSDLALLSGLLLSREIDSAHVPLPSRSPIARKNVPVSPRPWTSYLGGDRLCGGNEFEEVEDQLVADLSRLAKPIISTVDEDAEFGLLSTVMKIDLFWTEIRSHSKLLISTLLSP